MYTIRIAIETFPSVTACQCIDFYLKYSKTVDNFGRSRISCRTILNQISCMYYQDNIDHPRIYNFILFH